MTATEATRRPTARPRTSGTTTSGTFKLPTLKVVFLDPKALPDSDATPPRPLLDPALPTVLRLID